MVEIESIEYCGLVYDLMVADDHSFVAEGIVVHNCAMIPLVEGYPLPQIPSAREWFERLEPDEQKHMMGRGRWEAWQDGLFTFDQLVTTHDHPVWGPSAHVTSLSDLLKGRGGIGGVPIDPAALLAAHKETKSHKPAKPRTAAVDENDTQLLQKLLADVTDGDYLPATKKAVTKALLNLLGGGHKGFVYFDEDGELESVVSYENSGQYLKVTGLGLVYPQEKETLKVLADLADAAAQNKQGISLYVPNGFKQQYLNYWGFLVQDSLSDGAVMKLPASDVAAFKKDPAGFGQKQAEALTAAAQAALADPAASFTFRTGQPIAGLPFSSVKMKSKQFADQTKLLAYEPPLEVGENQHPAAGMLLFTPDGKLVLVDPANHYGGYETTFPKGTQDEYFNLQETAVKEVWEESGFKAKVLGLLGDYTKSTSVTRYYIGVVEDGAPWDAHYETEAVRIVPLADAQQLLNVGVDKEIFQDLQAVVAEAFGDGSAFDIGKLEAYLDKVDADAADAVAQAAAAAQKAAETAAKQALETAVSPTPPTTQPTEPQKPTAAKNAPTVANVAPLPDGQQPANVTKKVLVEHLVALTGKPKWKATVMTKAQLVRLFDYPVDEAAAAIDAAGTAHTLKYKKTAVSPTVQPPEPTEPQKPTAAKNAPTAAKPEPAAAKPSLTLGPPPVARNDALAELNKAANKNGALSIKKWFTSIPLEGSAAEKYTNVWLDGGELNLLLSSHTEMVSLSKKMRIAQAYVKQIGVQFYIERLAAGKPIPPVTAVREKNGELTIVDGHHRLVAAQLLGYDQIPIQIIDEDALANPPSPDLASIVEYAQTTKQMPPQPHNPKMPLGYTLKKFHKKKIEKWIKPAPFNSDLVTKYNQMKSKAGPDALDEITFYHPRVSSTKFRLAAGVKVKDADVEAAIKKIFDGLSPEDLPVTVSDGNDYLVVDNAAMAVAFRVLAQLGDHFPVRVAAVGQLPKDITPANLASKLTSLKNTAVSPGTPEQKKTAVSPTPAVDPAAEAYKTVAAWHTAGHADPLRLSIDELKLAYAYAKVQQNGGMMTIIRDAIVAAEAVPAVELVKGGHADIVSTEDLKKALAWLESVGPAGAALKAYVEGVLKERAAAEAPPPDPNLDAWEKVVGGTGPLTAEDAKRALAYMRAHNLDILPADQVTELQQLANTNVIQFPPGLSYGERAAWLVSKSNMGIEAILMLSPDELSALQGMPWDEADFKIIDNFWDIHHQSASVVQTVGKELEPLDIYEITDYLVDNHSLDTIKKLVAAAAVGENPNLNAIRGELIEALKVKADAETAAPVSPPSFPKPPKSMTKSELVDTLVGMYGLPGWKLNLIPASQLKTLATQSAEVITKAADDAAAQHAAKYKKPAKTAKTAKPDVGAPTPPDTAAAEQAWQKYQSTGVTSMTSDEILAAGEYAKNQGKPKAVVDFLHTAYQHAIGDPIVLPLSDASQYTKAELVKEINKAFGLPIYKLNTLKKDVLVTAVGKPVSELYKALGLPYQPTPKQPQSSQQPSQQQAKKDDPQQQPPPLINDVDEETLATYKEMLNEVFLPGTPEGNGVKKAVNTLLNDNAPTLFYTTPDNKAAGIIAVDTNYNTQYAKVTGAAFADRNTSLAGVADAANMALAEGKGLFIYVPDKLKKMYQKWGFKEHGIYLKLEAADIPKLVTLAGKKPAKPSPPKKPTAGQQTAGYPLGMTDPNKVMKLTKAKMVEHLASALELPASKFNKYTKSQLFKFMELPLETAKNKVNIGAAPPSVKKTAAAGLNEDSFPKPPKKEWPLPPNLPAFQMPDPPGFPPDTGNLRVVSRLGGSTGAELVEDPATGKRYVRKRGNSKEHLLEEAYADNAYRAAGLNVPVFKVYETADGPVKLAEYKDDLVSLGNFIQSASTSERRKVLDEVRKGFAVDALMGNWDVLGADLDNVMIDKNGRVWRIDNGGSFRYRAQGIKKDDEYLTEYPVELWTMRDKRVGPKNAQIFGSMDIYQVMDSVRAMLPNKEAVLAAVPDDLRPLVNGRFAIMEDLLATSDTFRTDKWKADYTDPFLEQSTYIRRAGLIDALPKQMKQKSRGSTTVYDDQGREFDRLRGSSSHVERFAQYMRENGGDPKIIKEWMSGQAGSSWSPESQALKWYLVQSRDKDPGDFYWREGASMAEDTYSRYMNNITRYGGYKNKKESEAVYKRTFAMWHAWVYESLRHMEFNRKKGDHVELVRTENKEVLTKLYGVRKGDRNVLIPRGACESGSIYRAKRIVAGGEVTRQRVPIHRIMGYYWTDRPGRANYSGGFLGNAENEFVFLPDGIPFDYIDSVSSSKGVEAYWNE